MVSECKSSREVRMSRGVVVGEVRRGKAEDRDAGEEKGSEGRSNVRDSRGSERRGSTGSYGEKVVVNEGKSSRGSRG